MGGRSRPARRAARGHRVAALHRAVAVTGPEFRRPAGVAGPTRPAAPPTYRRTVPAAPQMRRSAPGTVTRRLASPTASGAAVAPAPSAPPVPPPTSPRTRGVSWRRYAVVAVVSASLAVGVLGGVSALRRDDLSASPPPASSQLSSRLTIGQVANQALPSVVSVQVRSGSRRATGSGFVVDDGVVVTNAHVVGSPFADVRVKFSSGASTDADVLGLSTEDDLAVLRVQLPSGVAPLPLADASLATAVGDEVIAVGSPLGLAGTVTAGIVSATDRQVRLGSTRAQRRPDRRVHQPRQLRRPAHRPPRPGDRGEHLDRQPRWRQHRHRVRHPGRPGAVGGRPADLLTSRRPWGAASG